jgi:hypothetical protein
MQYDFQTKKLKKKGGENIIFTFIQRFNGNEDFLCNSSKRR